MRESYTDKVRAIIRAAPDEAITSHIVRQKIPGIGDMASETLRKMQKAGELRRVNTRGRPTYKLNTSYQPVRLRNLPTPPKPSTLQQSLITGIARSTPPRARRNVLLCTVGPSPSHCPRRALSARISADVAAFEANGGQVERLGNTERFRI